MKKLKEFEIWSAVGTIVFGSMLHFAFAWSGNWHPLALIAAVNESTWEHLKLAFWPAFIFSAIAYFSFAKDPKEGGKNFCLAQAKKLFLMPFLIVILFYGWRHFFADNFIYDISIFTISIILGHLIAYLIETNKFAIRHWENSQSIVVVCLLLISLLLIAFSLFTFFPPHIFLFRDPVDGGYGIMK